jgi:hypothetical protein
MNLLFRFGTGFDAANLAQELEDEFRRQSAEGAIDVMPTFTRDRLGLSEPVQFVISLTTRTALAQAVRILAAFLKRHTQSAGNIKVEDPASGTTIDISADDLTRGEVDIVVRTMTDRLPISWPKTPPPKRGL